jgi:hypothetical protein
LDGDAWTPLKFNFRCARTKCAYVSAFPTIESDNSEAIFFALSHFGERLRLAHKFVTGTLEQHGSHEVCDQVRGTQPFRINSLEKEKRMRNMQNFAATVAVAGLFAFPLTAQAQGISGGAARGAEQGGEAAGPVGAAVGGVVGGVTGGVAGLLGVDQRPRFREYVVREHIPSYTYREPVTVGMVLPPAGVPLYAIPHEFGVPPEYRYAVVNDQAVFVEPSTRRIVDVID